MTTATKEPVALDIDQKPDVKYAIPNWLRDEQIKSAVRRISRRLEKEYALRSDPIAVVGFGPSLKDTWEQIRGFRYVMSCSGAHKFLLSRGIVPTWHVEVDPREHKVGLMGEPHPDVQYLISSTCHPKVFDHLAQNDVTLWHVFDASDEGIRVLPRGEALVTGGCDVGLRSLALAAHLGFRDVQVFGMDGNAREEARHADTHPNNGAAKNFSDVEYPKGSGVMWKTTPGMLAAVQGVKHEVAQMSKVRFTFHGEGLIQRVMQDYEAPKVPRPTANIITMERPELISADYREQNAKLHRDNLLYGVGGAKHAVVVKALVEQLKTTSVLDYGCGKGMLAQELDFPIWEYDPAIPEKSALPRPADIVVCTDVLEHIEPEKLTFVLDDLRRVTRKVGYLVIHTKKSSKSLSDGRNAHLIQRGKAWWTGVLKKFFVVGKVIQRGPLLYVVVGPKPKEQKAA